MEVTCSLAPFVGTTELGNHVLFLKSNTNRGEQNELPVFPDFYSDLLKSLRPAAKSVSIKV